MRPPVVSLRDATSVDDKKKTEKQQQQQQQKKTTTTEVWDVESSTTLYEIQIGSTLK